MKAEVATISCQNHGQLAAESFYDAQPKACGFPPFCPPSLVFPQRENRWVGRKEGNKTSNTYSSKTNFHLQITHRGSHKGFQADVNSHRAVDRAHAGQLTGSWGSSLCYFILCNPCGSSSGACAWSSTLVPAGYANYRVKQKFLSFRNFYFEVLSNS